MTAVDPTPDELELQDQVAKVLESQGVIAKIKAQLRAAVFDVIHGSGSNALGALRGSRMAHSAIAPSISMVESFGSDGRVALEIVRNFLECLELEHTLTVFLAESRLDCSNSDDTKWRLPSQLCELVNVRERDEQTPILVKMLRSAQRFDETKAAAVVQEPTPPINVREHDKVAQEISYPGNSLGQRWTEAPEETPSDLVSHPLLQTRATTDDSTLKLNDDNDGDLDASMAEEIVSGSFEEESLAESASVSRDRYEDVNQSPIAKPVPSQTKNSSSHDEEGNEGDDEISPSVAEPPPAPTTLPSFEEGVYSRRTIQQEEGDADQESLAKDSSSRHEDEDELDDDEAVARLRSLEEKLKEMEAQDDTGVLQMLKVGKQAESEDRVATSDFTKGSQGDEAPDDDDNYGSDFEEEVEDMEEVESELSEDIASASVLSDSESVQVPARATETDPYENDKAVESEDALNSYDYIEAVEKQ